MATIDTQRWVRNASDELAVREGCHFDEAAAERVAEFFRKFLRHSKGQWAGKPFDLLPWQWSELIGPLFGWKRPDGNRRFRRAFVSIPKKNGKSTIAAGIGLYMLVGDGEDGAEVYSCGFDRDQASIVHSEAMTMVQSSEPLLTYLNCNKSNRQISFNKTNSVYKSLSGEARKKEGLNASCLIKDEVHVWRGRDLWDSLKYAGRSRAQPLDFSITTAGDDVLSVAYEQYIFTKQVLSGAIPNTRQFGLIYEAEPADDYRDPEVWAKANPSLGETINAEDFREDVREAEQTPTTLASFKRYGLNIWKTGRVVWLDQRRWDRCGRDFTLDDVVGLPVCGALDLARTRDMSALVLCFRDSDKGLFYLWPYFWVPEEWVRDNAAPEQYRIWASNGFLRTTPGEVTDFRFLKKQIGEEIAPAVGLTELAYDPWKADQLVQELSEEYGIEPIAFGQNFANFAEPTDEFEKLTLSCGLVHPNHPVLTWQAGHVEVRVDPNGNKRPVKPTPEDPRKIDGIVAGIMGLARAITSQTAAGAIEYW